MIRHCFRQTAGNIQRNLPGIDHLADHRRQHTAEHFKTGTVTEKFAGVRNHPGKIHKQVHTSNVFKLTFHPHRSIAQPPCRSQSDLASESSCYSGKSSLLPRIKAVENSFNPVIQIIEPCQQSGQLIPAVDFEDLREVMVIMELKVKEETGE